MQLEIWFGGLHLCVNLLLNQGDSVWKHPIWEDGMALGILIKLVQELGEHISIFWQEEGIVKPLKLSLSINGTTEEVKNGEFKLLKTLKYWQQRSHPQYPWLFAGALQGPQIKAVKWKTRRGYAMDLRTTPKPRDAPRVCKPPSKGD